MRELASRNRVIKSSERWSSGTKDLPPLKPVKFQRGDLSLYLIRLNFVNLIRLEGSRSQESDWFMGPVS